MILEKEGGQSVVGSKAAKASFSLLLASVLLALFYAVLVSGDLSITPTSPSNETNASLTISTPTIGFNGSLALFNVTVTVNSSDVNLSNVSLYLGTSAGTVDTLVNNQTQWINVTGPTSLSVLFNVSTTFNDGEYFWLIEAMQNDTTEGGAEATAQFNFTSTNLSFIVDSTPPGSVNLSNTSSTAVATGDTVYISAAFLDSLTTIHTVRLFANVSGASDNEVNITTDGSKGAGDAGNASLVNLSYKIPADFIGQVLNFTLQANDSVNNVNITQAIVFEVEGDGTSPGPITLDGPVDGFNTSADAINLTFTAYDNNDTSLSVFINISLAGVPYTNISGISVTNGTAQTNETTVPLISGVYTWNVTVTDGAGNQNTSVSRTFTVDQIAPNVSVVSPANDSHVLPAANVTVQVFDNQTGVPTRTYDSSGCGTDGSYTNNSAFTPFTSCTGTSNVTLTVVAGDQPGNIQNLTVSYGVDAQGPFLGQHTLLSGSTQNNPVVLNISVNESFVGPDGLRTNVSSVSYLLDDEVSFTIIEYGEDGINMTSGDNVIVGVERTLSLGSHSVLFSANDSVGNIRNSSLISFTVLGDLDFNTVNDSLMIYNADVKNMTTRNGSGDAIDGQTQPIDQTLTFFLDTAVTSTRSNVTITFNGSAASWKDINFSVKANDSSINGHINNNQTTRVIDSIYLNGSIQHFLPSNNSYYGNVSFNVNVSDTDMGTASFLYFENHDDLSSSTNITACGSDQFFGPENTTGLPCWNNIDDQRVEIIVPHFSVVAFTNDTTAPTISRNFPVATQTVGEFAPNITVSADAVSCFYVLNNSASSVTNASSAQSSSISPSGQTCAFDPIRFKDGSYNVTFNVSDAAGNYKNTTYLFTVADVTAPNNGTAITSSGGTTGGTITISGVNESVNATVFYGTTSAASDGTSTQTDFGQKQVVSISGLSTVTSARTIYYNVSLCDFNGNCNLTRGFSFTQTATSSDSDSSSSDSSGSSGSGGAAAPTTNTQATTGQVWASVPAGESVSMTISNNQIAITQVRFSATKEIRNGGLDVSSLKANPVSVSPVGTAYQFLQFSRSNLVDGSFRASVEVSFVVPVSWLSDNGVDAGDVALYRYTGGEWNELETSLDRQDGTNAYYTAITPGFSYFAIASTTVSQSGDETQEDPVETTEAVQGPEQEETAEQSIEEESAEEQQEGGFSIWMIILLIAVVLAGAGIWMYQRRKD